MPRGRRLHAGGHTLPPRVTRHANVTGSTQAADLRELPVVVSTAKKWSFVSPDRCEPWRWALVDEAYQMRSDALHALLATAPLFGEDGSQVLFVDTANRLQGREFDVTLVWRPLSGRHDASTLYLETGPPVRPTVPAPLRVHRDGPRRHPRSSPVFLDVPPKFPDGWRAHQVVMEHLERGEHRAQGAGCGRRDHGTNGVIVGDGLYGPRRCGVREISRAWQQ